jgi:uncharacterized membrane protein YfcA
LSVDTLHLAFIFGTGVVAGLINVLAGGGSFLTLPVLILSGLPASAANATNRVGILAQNMGAVWGFHRYRVLDWASLRWAAVPATAGSFLGVWLALVIPDALFQKVLAFLMVGITLFLLWEPKPLERTASGPGRRFLIFAAFVGVGIYGGFVQAGVGFLILAATSAAGMDLVRGNAVKVLCILVFTAVSLPVFALSGLIWWLPGLVLAAGNVLGGLAGVRLTVLKGHRWIKAVVTIAILVFAVKLWSGG